MIHFEEQWALRPPDFDTTLLSFVTEFNHKGKPIEKFQYSKYDGSMIILTKWTYDDNFNISTKITDNKEANKVFHEKYTYEYDKKDRKVRMLEQNSNNTDELEHIYVYHDDGSYTDTIKVGSQLLSIMDYNENDKIINGKNLQQQSSIYNEFDEHGNNIKRKTSYADGPGNVITYTNGYDSHGNLIRKSLGDRYREYEYNENGDVVKETWFDKGQHYLIFLYKYEYFE